MKKKMIIKLSILLSMIILCSCTKKEESMFPNANNIKETQINKAKSYKVSEDITIDKKYLEFGKAFEEKFINQQNSESRTINETLDLGWEVLKILPKEEWDKISVNN